MPQAAHGCMRAIRPRMPGYLVIWSCNTIAPNQTASPMMNIMVAVRYSDVFGCRILMRRSLAPDRVQCGVRAQNFTGTKREIASAGTLRVAKDNPRRREASRQWPRDHPRFFRERLPIVSGAERTKRRISGH